MRGRNDDSILDLPDGVEATLIEGARCAERVRGLTHSFYKYPARFSPTFVRAVIESFSCPGDLVLDNHVGGGTTLVEAIAAGRDAIGVDISTLAEFVARVKTTVYSASELKVLEAWSDEVVATIHARRPSARISDYAEAGYYKHLDHADRWRIRKAIEQALESAAKLGAKRLENFGRCAVLRTAQWTLDGRAKLASLEEFREALRTTIVEMVQGASELRTAVARHSRRPDVEVINRSSAGIEDDERLIAWRPPRLVVTSPPYPGIHVLYHRWQVDGRKEAPLPFMIANRLDGAGSSYYTMGDRKNPGLKTYFDNIRATMRSVAELADEKTIVVQMLAFSDPSWQLPRYIETMEEAGLAEVFLPSLAGEGDGRLWRSVPGRRWYCDRDEAAASANEVVLIHRKAMQPVRPSRSNPIRRRQGRLTPGSSESGSVRLRG